MAAILVCHDASGWYESGPVHDLAIRGNQFLECGGSVIEVTPHIKTFAAPLHRNIRIEENTFTLSGNKAAFVNAADGLTVTGNTFLTRNGTPPAATDLIQSQNTTGLNIKRNTVRPAPEKR